MAIRFYFDSVGGFHAIDDSHRIASYAFPSSDGATAARRDPETVAGSMIARDLAFLIASPDAEKHARFAYDYACRKFPAPNSLQIYNGFELRHIVPGAATVFELATYPDVITRSRFSSEFWKTVADLCAAGA